ncbi:MAG: ABC transporter ATP-binding protein [bacterium]|nr:ABC transporter ATP-binding protein [bacterium]
MISIEDISFSYRKKNILRSVSLEIRQGDCIGFLGANGCGKSTLLSLIAGVRTPKSGRILFDGKPLNTALKQSGAIGYVPQDNPLIPDLSVRDNLKLWYHGDHAQFQKELSEGFLHLLGVSDFLHMPAAKLSGGMKKRVSIGMALQNHPRVLILDEPSAALDLPCKADIRSYLSVYLQNGGTILITTHEETELVLCSRLYLLYDGQLHQTEPTMRGEQLLALIQQTTNQTEGKS